MSRKKTVATVAMVPLRTLTLPVQGGDNRNTGRVAVLQHGGSSTRADAPRHGLVPHGADEAMRRLLSRHAPSSIREVSLDHSAVHTSRFRVVCAPAIGS